MLKRRPLLLILILLVGLSIYSWVYSQPIPLPSDPSSAGFQSQSRAVVELLTNTSFEVDANADKIPDGWTGKKTADPNADKRQCNKPNKVVSHSGDCAFKFKSNPSGTKSKLKQAIINTGAVVNGSTLTLSAFVNTRDETTNSKVASAKFKLSNGSKLALELQLPPSPNYGYLQLIDTLIVNLPNGVTITSAAVDFRYGETFGKYLVDDVSLTVTTADAPTATPTLPAPSQTPSQTPDVQLPPAKFSPATNQADDRFGYSVSISADGNTAIVGAPYDTVGADNDQGAAYIYVRNGIVWSQQAMLDPSDADTGDGVGTSVSISADGNTAIVGTPRHNVGSDSDQGAAYVFIRNGTTWTQQQKLTVSNGEEGDYFGNAVSLSADGNRALVGARFDNIGQNNSQGAAYVFTRTANFWNLQQQLVANNGAAEDEFGTALSLSGDGSTALIGVWSDDIGANTNQGSGYVFAYSGGVWTQQQQLVASDGAAGDLFGISVSLNTDGSTALLGSPFDMVGANTTQGSGYIFRRTGNIWTQQKKLIASDGAIGDFLGSAVSLNGDGTRAVVGAYMDDVAENSQQGSAYLFVHSSNNWTQQQQFLASDGASEDYFGFALNMSRDGHTVLIGAYQDTVSGKTTAGSAWAFDLP